MIFKVMMTYRFSLEVSSVIKELKTYKNFVNLLGHEVYFLKSRCRVFMQIFHKSKYEFCFMNIKLISSARNHSIAVILMDNTAISVGFELE
jgi:hypothetical protein